MFDGLGLSFPDIVIGSRILGGETPKTKAMRENPDVDYETEFAKLSHVSESLAALCRPGVRVRIINDGPMAAFSAAAELAADGTELTHGVVAYALGTDLGSGWIDARGDIPEIPLELYDLLLDLGSAPWKRVPPEDIRSVRNENSGLPGGDIPPRAGASAIAARRTDRRVGRGHQDKNRAAGHAQARA